MSQTTLFDEIAPYNRLFIAGAFVSNGWLAVRMEEYHINSNGLHQVIEACGTSTGQAAHLCGFLSKIPDWAKRVAVFAPVDLHPPYDDLDKLCFINAASSPLSWVMRVSGFIASIN